MRGHAAKVLAGLAAAVLLLAGGMAAALFLYAELRLSRLVLGGLGEGFSTTVYAAPLLLRRDTVLSPERLLTRLKRLGYSEEPGTPDTPGEYAWSPPHLSVYLRRFRAPVAAQDPLLVTLKAEKDGRWSLQTFAGAPLEQVALEPELLAEISGPRRLRRDPATFEQIPEYLKAAVVAAEDKRFFRHWGLDARALARAFLHNLRGRSVHGGSTITQQLAKNYFLTSERSLRRKLTEALLAAYLELRMDKREILTLYLNHIYMGQSGPVSVAGVRAAARLYFRKRLEDLDLGECAFLAGAIRSPYRYNPWRDPIAAQARRNWVLSRMESEGAVTAAQARQAVAAPLRVREPPEPPGGESAYAVAEVVRELVPRFGEDELFRYGLRVDTTLDPLLQRAASLALGAGPRQGALIALDPGTGAVLALSGGRRFSESQFNRATQARRQPGSAFKPFVYAAALEAGFTPATLLTDTTREFRWGDKVWKPRNYDGVYKGTATLREALAHSLNAATLDLMERTGTEKVRRFAVRLGIRSPLEPSLALALGSYEVTLWDLTGAYAAFGNGGFRVSPHLVAAVSDASGNLLEAPRSEREQVLDPAAAYLLTSLLETAVKEGTARSLVQLGFEHPAAGKTGTTNEGADAWFVGYTPRLLAGVWVGEDRRRPLRLTGAKDALPIWARFMREASGGFKEDFGEPPGLVSVKIDPLTGLKAVSGCPIRREEKFLKGTEPTAYCPLHPSGLKGFWKRWFSRE